MDRFPLRLPDDLKEAAAEQVAKTGVSLNRYIAIALARRVAAQAEAERYFQARGKRAAPGRAKEILARAGRDNPHRPDDQLPD